MCALLLQNRSSAFTYSFCSFLKICGFCCCPLYYIFIKYFPLFHIILFKFEYSFENHNTYCSQVRIVYVVVLVVVRLACFGCTNAHGLLLPDSFCSTRAQNLPFRFENALIERVRHTHAKRWKEQIHSNTNIPVMCYARASARFKLHYICRTCGNACHICCATAEQMTNKNTSKIEGNLRRQQRIEPI